MLGKKIISAKIHNQKVVLKRYLRNSRKTLDEEIKMLKIQEEKVWCAKSVNQIMGYEGIAARYYFQGLSQLIDKQFTFTGRNRRPPKDEFNSMISLGYSILMNEYYGKIVAYGLNPYFGFIHSDKERHPTLVSDLIEEWRAVIVDSLVMSLINGHEILKEHFAYGIDNPGIYLTTDGMKIFLNKYDKKIRTEVKYYEDESSMPFRRAMDIQIGKLVHAIEDEDITLYEPFKIR
ncbi:MAG: CRISPR-associated endonuclease Cas1 [Lachnospiraceae bacterium]|nr:CRISPR-associated endonuclease Cas1 [Lachnospiraceae bacterium]